MKLRKILICILIIVTCIPTCNTCARQAYASNHVHTDECYKTHVEYNYTGGIQTFTAPEEGDYILECWGAQAGTSSYLGEGGLGGYSKGTLHLNAGQILYVNVGGRGKDGVYDNTAHGGYNGGGDGTYSPTYSHSNPGGGGETDMYLSSNILVDKYITGDLLGGWQPIAGDLPCGDNIFQLDFTGSVCNQGASNIKAYSDYAGGFLQTTPLGDAGNSSFLKVKYNGIVSALRFCLYSQYVSESYPITAHLTVYSPEENRLIVAGGGGIGGHRVIRSSDGSHTESEYPCRGGDGGGLTYGYNGELVSGTSTSGFLKKFGANGAGGGYYGGKAAVVESHTYYAIGGNTYMWDDFFPAGGGSNYVGGVTNGVTQAGVRYGDGHAKITSATPVCAAVTIAPQISLNNMSSDTILTESNSAFCPQVKVYDNENDILSCNYYLDGNSTATGTVTANQSKPETLVSFPNGINALNLSEGTHTIKVTAEDDMAPKGESSLSFKVDKSPPIVSSVNVSNTSSSIKLDVAASDAVAGLAGSAYRYTIGGVATDWLTTSSYTKSSLASNTNYNYTVEVRDSAGHITTKTGSISTKAAIPQITADAFTNGDIRTVIKDANPAGTKYLIKVGSQYANSDGTLSSSENWITPAYDASVSGKRLILTGLSPDTTYTITVSAQNNGDGATVPGGSVTAVTAPELSTDLKVSSVKYGEILLNWSIAKGAVSYELNRQEVSTEGTVTDTRLISDIITNHYSDTNLTPYQKYRYYIRSRNQFGTCSDWSATPVSVKAIPQKPAKVTAVDSEAEDSGLNITWTSISGAVGYEVEVSYEGKLWTGRAADNKLHIDTKIYNCQSSIRVRAFNVSDDSNPSDSSLWSNVGDWSNSLVCYTGANQPTLDDIKPEQVKNDAVTITWSGNDNPASVQYVLGIYKENALLEERTITGNPIEDNKLTQLITGLDSETDYKFRLRAVNSAGITTDWSNEVAITTQIDRPALVTGLCATAKSDRVTLSWNASLRAQSYIIERDGVVIADHIVGTSYIDQKVAAETEYIYRVKAVNITGESGWSQQLTKKTLGELPVAPTVTVVTGSAISLEVKWTPVNGATGYDVQADGKLHNVGMNFSYTDDGLVPGSTHNYRVRSRNDYGNSDWSETITATLAVIAPELPTNLKVSSVKYDEILLDWSIANEAVSYDLLRQAVTTNGAVTDTKLISDIITNHYSDTDLSPYQKYRYYIRSKNQYGTCSDWSATPINVKAIPQKPVKVTDIVSESEGSVLDITWASISGAVGYEVEVSYDSKLWTGRATDNKISFDTKLYNCQSSIRVRTYNVNDDSNPSDSSLWSNVGDWSNSLVCYTGANQPTLDDLNPEQVKNDSVTITWSGNDNPPSVQYVLGIYKDNALLEERIITGNPTEDNKLTQVITGLESEKDYKLRLRAVNSAGITTDWSNEVTITTQIDRPAFVTGLCATAKSDRVTLSWNASLRAQTYTVERDGKVIADHIVGTSYIDQKVAADTEYIYRVKAVNATGESGWSQQLTKKTLGELPVAPTVTVVTGSAISLEVKWTPVNGATGYDVDTDGKVHNVGMNTSYTDDGLTPGSTHNYRVRTRNDYGNSDWSEAVTITLAPKVVIPIPKTPVLQSSVSGSALVLSWSNTEGASIYQLEADGSIRYTGSGTEYIHTDLLPDSVHTYRVRAGNESGYSNWSEPITVTIGSIDSTTPQNLKYHRETDSTTAILWDKVVSALGYRIEVNGLIAEETIESEKTVINTTPGVQYKVRVAAILPDGEGTVLDWSEEMVFCAANNLPDVPSINKLTATDDSISITWFEAERASGYEVECNGKISDVGDHLALHIGGLMASSSYFVRVRAYNEAGKGEWSTAQTIMTGKGTVVAPVIKIVQISTPTNLSVKEVDGKVHLTWLLDGTADSYEVEVDGVVYATTQGKEFDFNKDLFCVERAVRVRACKGADKGEWSLTLQVCNTLSKSEEFEEGEEFSVLLPVKKADKGKYKFTLEYNPNEVELLDACKATPNAETMTVYIKKFKLLIIISQEGERNHVTYIFDEGSSKWSGLIGSLRFRSKVRGNITLLLGVAEK